MALAVATTSNKTATASTTCVPDAPASIASGNILLAFVAKNTTSAPSGVPSGWALMRPCGAWRQNFESDVLCSGNVGTGWAGIYWKEATGSEPSTYTWTSSSSTWNIQIARLTGYRGVKPGGALVDDVFCNYCSDVQTRSTNTIGGANLPESAALVYDGYLMFQQYVQTVVGSTCTFSGLAGTMTQIANSNQTGVSQLVAWEYVDMTSNPLVSARTITTDQASGSTGGFGIWMSDPPSITGDDQDTYNDTPRMAA